MVKTIFCQGTGTCPGCHIVGIALYKRAEQDQSLCLKCLDRNQAITIEEWLTL